MNSEIRNVANQGGKWIRPEKRLAIYLRDRFTCTWCGEKLTELNATLDHLSPQSNGVNNLSKNLVSSCKRCNSARGNRSMTEFALVVASYINHGETCENILRRIRRRRRRRLSIEWAKALIGLHRSFSEIGRVTK
jgi:hypothetical protein